MYNHLNDKFNLYMQKKKKAAHHFYLLAVV